MKSFDPRIEWRDPASLTPYSNNAKTHPTEQIDKIAASIASFGFDQPIVVDGDGVIIKGHGRREASLRLGLDRVPVLVRDDLSVAEIKAARIADNKTAESPFDEDMLRVELEALMEQDFDVSLTGFDLAEIDELLAAAEPEQAGLTEDDDVPRRPNSRSRGRASSGSSAATGCCAAMRRCWPMSSGCRAASWRTWSGRTRHTTSTTPTRRKTSSAGSIALS
jgi:hypothetical protein